MPAGFDGIFTNLTIEVLNNSCVIVAWSPPYNGIISYYILNISPLPNMGLCSASGQCMTDTEHATITGLEINTKYALTIMASACHTVSYAVTTYLLLNGSAGWLYKLY